MRTFPTALILTLAFAATVFVAAPFAQAESFSYTQIDQSLCSPGCSAGDICVKSSTTAGDPPNTPICISAGAANNVNYTDSVSCSTSCGHTCTVNMGSYIQTYYCGPATITPPPTTVGPQTIIPPPTTVGPGGTTGQTVTLVNPLGSNTCSANGTCLSSFLSSIMKFVVQIGSIIVILMLVFVGYKFVVAQGSDSKLTEAKQMLLWTIVGALILLGAQAISLGIQSTVQALGG